MSRNNQNNIAAWVKRVREYDVIPEDVVYSKEEILKKLQHRRKNRPAKRRIYIYWAAAAIFAIILIPLLWNLQGNNAGNLQNEPIVKKPAINTKSPGVISKPDPQQLIVHENQHQKDLQLKKNTFLPMTNKDKFLSKDQKATNELATKKDSVGVNKSIAILNIKHDTINEKKNISIVHINNMSTDQPQSEVDNRKLRRFMRRYDVDVPQKTDATGTTNNGSIIKNIN